MLNELFTRHLLTAEDGSEVARKGWRGWGDRLAQVLLTKPAEVVQEACQVMKKHGYSVKKKLKSELYYSSTLCQVVFHVLHSANCKLTELCMGIVALLLVSLCCSNLLTKYGTHQVEPSTNRSTQEQ